MLENGDVRVGVFPKGEEVLIGGAGLGEGTPLWHKGIAPSVSVVSHGRDDRAACGDLEGVGAGEAEARKRSDGARTYQAAVIEDLLKLLRCLFALTRTKVGFAAHVGRVRLNAERDATGR